MSLTAPARRALDDPLAFADDALRRAAGARLASVAVPAPRVPAERSLCGLGDQPAMLLDSDDDQVVGVGVARRMLGRGDDRLADVLRAARSLGGATTAAHPACAWAAAPIRAFGGLAFVPRSPSEAWRGFADADFVVPRWLYRRRHDSAALILTLPGQDAANPRRRRAAIDRLGERLAELTTPSSVDRRPRVVEVIADDPRPFLDAVEATRRAIGDGRFAKAVLARSTRRRLAAASDPAALVGALDRVPGGTRFAIVRDGRVFLGATPERLVRRRGDQVATEALAGTAARAATLLASAKDRHEHQLVVDAILGRLEPLCDRLLSPPRPSVRRLPGLVHLHTPIRGQLRRAHHVLELVERLHPTPAVGGTPSAEALAWIAEREGIDRGWYSAPVGWFDSVGDGEFSVALRCGLVDGDQLRTFAGAGIVATSDPRRELRETEMKQAALLAALGLDPTLSTAEDAA